jgi:Fic family protein
MSEFILMPLPPAVNLETTKILKQAAASHRALAELKGYASVIPNKNILINAVTINEAKDSSEIENIVTTHDEIYKAMLQNSSQNTDAKEVVRYRSALWHGYESIKARSMITVNSIIEVQEIIEDNSAGIRRQAGTVLKNMSTGEIVYTPPGNESEILELMKNLEIYINEDFDGADILVKLAVIHYQFESIHPFYDGNGRTGRILNVLYLVLKDLLDSPILYLSKYIIKNKSSYYKLLQDVRNEGSWEEWVLFILEGIEKTSASTLAMIMSINNEFVKYAEDVKQSLPKIYSKELIELLFYEFYTKITYIEKGLNVSRKTASLYLNELEANGFLVSQKIGKERIYVNSRLLGTVKAAAER